MNAKANNAVKPTLLFLGGAYADIPMIEAAKALGFRVVTLSGNDNAPGHRHADDSISADYSDHSVVLEHAQRLSIDAVCPGCNDLCALSAAYVAAALGLPGHDDVATAQLIHHKDSYREFAIEHGVPTPKAKGFSDESSAREYAASQPLPLMIKPIDLGSGAGISKVRSADEIDDAIREAFEASMSKRVVIEDFIEGTRHGYSTIIVDQTVVFDFLDDEHYFLNPYLVSGASTPSANAEGARAGLRQVSQQIAKTLSLKDGIFHVQFILREGEAFIIEICRRPPGDWYPHFVRLATGVDYPEWIVRGFAGLPLDVVHERTPESGFTRHCVMSRSNGVYQGLDIDARIRPLIQDEFLVFEPGDIISDHLVQRLGIIFIKYSNMDQMEQLGPQLQDLVIVKTDA